MTISYYGRTCFKIQSGENILAIDPFGKGTGLTPPRFEAHVVLLTDPKAKTDFSLTGSPLIFNTPGEYEARDISCVGFHTPEGTPFFIEWEGIGLLHLGRAEKKESIDPILDYAKSIDIVMISGAKPKEAQKILATISPRIVIPMESAPLLVKELDGKSEKLDKLTIRKKNLPQEGERIIILEAPGA